MIKLKILLFSLVIFSCKSRPRMEVDWISPLTHFSSASFLDTKLHSDTLFIFYSEDSLFKDFKDCLDGMELIIWQEVYEKEERSHRYGETQLKTRVDSIDAVFHSPFIQLEYCKKGKNKMYYINTSGLVCYSDSFYKMNTSCFQNLREATFKRYLSN